jgi:hypothetical protein
MNRQIVVDWLLKHIFKLLNSNFSLIGVGLLASVDSSADEV